MRAAPSCMAAARCCMAAAPCDRGACSARRPCAVAAWVQPRTQRRRASIPAAIQCIDRHAVRRRPWSAMATVQASHAVGLPCVRPSPAATAAVATAASGTPCGCSAAWSLGHLHAWGHGREHSRLHARRRRRADPAEGGDGGGVAQPSLGSAAEEGTLPLHQPGTPPPLAMTGRERQRAAEAAGQGQGRGKRPPPQPPPLVVAAGTAWSADVTKLRSRAAASKRKDKELFARIKDDRRLDARFHELHESAFSCIDCLECANCCKTTSPRVLGKDVDRLARFLRMRPAEVVKTYLCMDEDGDYVFQQTPCPFLGPDNKCSVYASRPSACAWYPGTDQRRVWSELRVTLENVAVCPAVAGIVERLHAEYGGGGSRSGGKKR
uniref:Zinc/iron-chelating domain-containing protein n=1 Tax=Chlamydomonas euryale TaxID=1486919 RepID=A0A6U2CML4_9CHLO|mmetsp:Transcript_15415/g.45423  ORF Transcript_15415/g.45423 Transcript_15415/m.45423 type:complete len:379 (+) Transcript_15415:3294-4430(+)